MNNHNVSKYKKYKLKTEQLLHKMYGYQQGGMEINGINIDDNKLTFLNFVDGVFKLMKFTDGGEYVIVTTGTSNDYTLEIQNNETKLPVMRLKNNKKTFIITIEQLTIEISGDILEFDHKSYSICDNAIIKIKKNMGKQRFVTFIGKCNLEKIEENIVITVKIDTINDQLFISNLNSFDLVNIIVSLLSNEEFDINGSSIIFSDIHKHDFCVRNPELLAHIFVHQFNTFANKNKEIYDILLDTNGKFMELVIKKELEELADFIMNACDTEKPKNDILNDIITKLDSHNYLFSHGQNVKKDRIMSMSNVKPTLKIITWNILAHQATKWYNARYNHREEDESVQYKPQNETTEQKIQRHALTIEKLSKEDADVILFQEIDYEFYLKFKIELWKKYDIVFNAFTNKTYYGTGIGAFGTGIAYKKNKFEHKVVYEYIQSSDYEEYAGKNALLLTLTLLDSKIDITFVSIHLTGKDGPFSNNLLRDVTRKILDLDNVIIGGDFNCNFKSKKNKCGYSISNKFTTIDNINDTTLVFDFGKDKYERAIIDKLYFTDLFTVFDYRVPIPKLDKDGYFSLYDEDGNVLNPSDHLYIVMTVQIG